jgi:hypothetical protein
MSINSIKNESILNPQRHTGLPSCLPPNQSLKLTEPAVDDFARAKQTATIGRSLPDVVMTIIAAALRCRSLALVR